MKKTKRLSAPIENFDKANSYSVENAIEILKKVPPAKFDETVEMSFKLGVDPKHADQMIRGSVMLPGGTGKTKKVLVFAKGDAAAEAKEAGADFVGDKDLLDKVQGGWMDFDAVVATPDMMKDIAILGKLLGPRGIMPSPKNNTVTPKVKKAIEDLKKGKVDFRVNKEGCINLPIGKISFDKDKIKENAVTVISAILRAKPQSLKGKYLRKLSMSATMSHGVKIDLASLS